MTLHRLLRAVGRYGAALLLVLWGGTLVEVAGAGSASRTFYVSATGDDAADGASVETAWRTLERAGRQVLRPGDQLLLRGGDAFSGAVVLDVRAAGDASRPVEIGSWGDDRATISPTGASAVVVHNTAGVEIHDLVLRGSGATTASSAGVRAYTDTGHLSGLSVRRVSASGFQYGIDIGAGPGSGFARVVVADSDLHENVRAGLILHGPPFDARHPTYAHRDVRIERVDASDNHGDPGDVLTNTGSGIVVGSTERGLVTASTAFGNGARCAAPEGPFGIWAYDSRAVTIEDSIAGSNRTGARDGGGFDLDQHTSDSTLRRNLSFDNDGPGFMLFAAADDEHHRGNAVLANVSIADVQRGGAGYGAITITGGTVAPRVEDNTVLRPGGRSKVPPVLVERSEGAPGEQAAGPSQG